MICNRIRTIAALSAAICLLNCSARAELVIPQGQSYEGDRSIFDNVVNHGSIIGSPEEPVVFAPGTMVSGEGYFANTRVEGTFAPGNSPAITNGSNQAFGPTSTVLIELGGTTPGFGNNNHDQINDSGTVFLFGGTLKVVPWNSFLPQPGDQFKIITWQTALVGVFSTMVVDPAFTNAGISFTQQVNNPAGPGNLTLLAVAIPESNSMLLVGAATLLLAAIRLMPRA
jgi:hypothetical protein